MRLNLSPLPISSAVWAAVSFISGCALVGGGSDLERARGYTIHAPQQWKSCSKGESDRAYTLPSGSLVTLVTHCNRYPDASLDVLTRQLLIGSKDRTIQDQQKITLGKHEGLLTHATAKVNTETVHLTLFVTRRSACVFDFSMMSSSRAMKQDIGSFKTFITSLEYEKE